MADENGVNTKEELMLAALNAILKQDIRDLRAQLAASQQRGATLAAALKPFADAYNYAVEDWADFEKVYIRAGISGDTLQCDLVIDDDWYNPLMGKHFAEARRALADTPSQEGNQ